jgi:hypothetical protein
MINPAWPEIAKAAPANLHHQMGHDHLFKSGDLFARDVQRGCLATAAR